MTLSFKDATLVELLHRASQCAEDAFARHASEHDVTARQYSLLCMVAHSQGLNQTAIGDAIGIDRSTVSEVITRLVQRSFLTRRRTERDWRAYEVQITPAGKDLLKNVELAKRTTEANLRAALQPFEHTTFRQSLTSMISAMDDNLNGRSFRFVHRGPPLRKAN